MCGPSRWAPLISAWTLPAPVHRVDVHRARRGNQKHGRCGPAARPALAALPSASPGAVYLAAPPPAAPAPVQAGTDERPPPPAGRTRRHRRVRRGQPKAAASTLLGRCAGRLARMVADGDEEGIGLLYGEIGGLSGLGYKERCASPRAQGCATRACCGLPRGPGTWPACSMPSRQAAPRPTLAGWIASCPRAIARGACRGTGRASRPRGTPAACSMRPRSKRCSTSAAAGGARAPRALWRRCLTSGPRICGSGEGGGRNPINLRRARGGPGCSRRVCRIVPAAPCAARRTARDEGR